MFSYMFYFIENSDEVKNVYIKIRFYIILDKNKPQ